jgi:cytosine deaminase
MNAMSSASAQYDFVVRNAALPGGRMAMDIAVRDGRIAAVAPHAELAAAGGATELDAQGQLVTPPFVDAHFHMDATLSHGLPRVNA